MEWSTPPESGFDEPKDEISGTLELEVVETLKGAHYEIDREQDPIHSSNRYCTTVSHSDIKNDLPVSDAISKLDISQHGG